MQDEDWGCASATDLFFAPGKTHSLEFLVEQISKDVDTSSLSAGSAGSPTSSDSMPSFTKRSSGGRPVAKKILKKRTAVGTRVPSLKHVTFEVETFVNTQVAPGEDRKKVEEQLAIRLGAKPLKSKPTNYKQLKEERQREKAAPGPSVDRFKLLSKGKKKHGSDSEKKRGGR